MDAAAARRARQQVLGAARRLRDQGAREGGDLKPLGEAPDATAVAALLTERWITDRAASIQVADGLRAGRPRLVLTIERGGAGARGRERIALEVTHLGPVEGARGAKDAWSALVDAVDALVGQLVESGYRHRELPSGSDVEHEGDRFGVTVAVTRPDLDAEADRWLRSS